jgi:DNA mismatch repair ATPase MutS
MVEDLEIAEERLKEAFTPFLTSLFSKFHESKFIWDAVIAVIAELDCLASLAIVSGQ